MASARDMVVMARRIAHKRCEPPKHRPAVAAYPIGHLSVGETGSDEAYDFSRSDSKAEEVRLVDTSIRAGVRDILISQST